MKVNIPYGSTVENNQLTLPEGFLSIDLDKKAFRLHDGVTQGGFEILCTQAYITPAGVNWTAQQFVGSGGHIIQNVGYANGLWVVVATSGRLFTSPDAVNWTQRADMGSSEIWGLAHNGTVWIAIGYYASGMRLYSSTDGIAWSAVTFTPGATRKASCLVYGNGLFVAGMTGDTNGQIATSPDGTTWTLRSTGLTGGYTGSVNFVNSLLVVTAGSQVASSTDGITWTVNTTGVTAMGGNYFTQIAYGASVYVGVGSAGCVYTSTDLITWTNRSGIFGTTHVPSVVFGKSTFLAVSYYGIATSTDGINWTLQDSKISNTIPMVKGFFVNNLFQIGAQAGWVTRAT